MKEFFDLIVPATNYKFVVAIAEGKAKHHPCLAIDEMERIARAECATGNDTFFSCASFGQASYVDETGKTRMRTQANAVAAKACWLDMDVGEDKPYQSQRDAAGDVRDFCDSHNLPKPMLVSSGAGLHCYWPFTEEVPKADWQPVASKLKALHLHGTPRLQADPTRTSDIASILRPVQTLNFKREANGEPIELLKLVAPIAFPDFKQRIDAAYAQIAAAIGPPNTNKRNRSAGSKSELTEIAEALKFIDPDRGQRSHWWPIIAAMADAFGEEGRASTRAWSRGDFMPQASDGYDACDFDAQFNDCLGRDHFDGDRVGLGTIIWLARQGGWTGGVPDWVRKVNEEHAWIEKDNAVYRIKFGDFAKAADFRQQFSNCYVEVPGGDQPKQVPAGDAWLKHPRRRQHESVVMRPDAGPVTAGNCLNVWRGFDVTAIPGDTRPFFALLNRLIPDPKAAEYVRCWIGHLLQRPHVKMNVALIVWSVAQGLGKNLLFECITQIIGRRHATKIEQAELASSFNGWLRDKVLVIGDEVIGEDRRQHADKLKGLITGTTIQINEKHQPLLEQDNLANFVFLSNHPTAMFVGDDDRRYFVWEVQGAPLPTHEASTFAAWRDGGGLAALLHEFQSMDLRAFNPKARAPSTTAKKMMVEANRSDLEVWAEQIISSGARNAIGREIATAQELADCYHRSTDRPKPSAKTVSATFKKLGARQREHQVRVGTVKLRPIALDRPNAWLAEPESSWAVELAKPITWPGVLPQHFLRTSDTQVLELHGLSQKRAA